MSLPLDPDECFWTPEGQEYARNRYIKNQAYLGNWENIDSLEEDEWTCFGLTQSNASIQTASSSTTTQKPSTTTTHRGASSMTGKLSLKSTGTGNLSSPPSSRHRKAAQKSGID